jgi:hypothetical protein
MPANEFNMNFSPDAVPMFDKTLLGSIRRPIDPMKWDIVLGAV